MQRCPLQVPGCQDVKLGCTSSSQEGPPGSEWGADFAGPQGHSLSGEEDLASAQLQGSLPELSGALLAIKTTLKMLACYKTSYV
jgi:hypothetical protein